MELVSTNYTIALAGQPNTGKSTIFNKLTGGNQHVGNWPGKTIEKKSGSFEYNDKVYNMIDLPGTYSLTSNSLEEKVTRDFIMNEKPDLIVVVVDASQIERTLYMLSEIIMFPVKIILAVNMMDVAENNRMIIDCKKLEKQLDIIVVPMTASKKQGLSDLVEVIEAECMNDYTKPSLNWEYGDITKEIEEKIKGKIDEKLPQNWVALKLLEEDKDISLFAEKNLSTDCWQSVNESLKKTKGGGVLLAAGERYTWIKSLLAGSLEYAEDSNQAGRRYKFDFIATHQLWGKILAVLILMLSLVVTTVFCMPLMKLLLGAIANISSLAKNSLSEQPAWIGSMIGDGMLPGVGISLVMLSFITPLFFILGFLEDVGYIARLSFVFDGFMNRLGLHGKSFISFILSFSCNLGGVMATRVIDSWKQRFLTIVMTSIIPCGAVWGVVGLLIAIFFSKHILFVVCLLLGVMILQLVITSVLMKKIISSEEHSGLIMELPPYHKPNLRTILIYTWTFMKGFMKRGFTLIAFVSFFVWLLSYFPNGNIETSFIASLGRGFNPISSLMGMDWRLFVALIAAIASKEAALASLAVIYGIGSGVHSITEIFSTKVAFENSALGEAILNSISPATALAFIFAFFFSIPCVGTLATIYSETRSLKSNHRVRSLLYIYKFFLRSNYLSVRTSYFLGFYQENPPL